MIFFSVSIKQCFISIKYVPVLLFYICLDIRYQNYSPINTKSSLNTHLLFSLVTFPCGKVASLSQWDRRQSTNIQSEYQGLICGQEECPWQVNKPRLILQMHHACCLCTHCSFVLQVDESQS